MSNGVSFNSVEPTYYGIQSNPRQCPRERSYLNEQCYDSVSFSGKEESNNTAGWIIRGTLALVGLTAGVAACFKGGRKWYSDTFNKIKSVFTGDTPEVKITKIDAKKDSVQKLVDCNWNIDAKKDSVDKVINNFDNKEELKKVLSNIKDDKNIKDDGLYKKLVKAMYEGKEDFDIGEFKDTKLKELLLEQFGEGKINTTDDAKMKDIFGKYNEYLGNKHKYYSEKKDIKTGFHYRELDKNEGGTSDFKKGVSDGNKSTFEPKGGASEKTTINEKTNTNQAATNVASDFDQSGNGLISESNFSQNSQQASETREEDLLTFVYDPANSSSSKTPQPSQSGHKDMMQNRENDVNTPLLNVEGLDNNSDNISKIQNNQTESCKATQQQHNDSDEDPFAFIPEYISNLTRY